MFNYKEANTDIIVNFHNSLNEKDKRRHAAMIYKNSSWNIEYVSKLLLISENTIRKGYGEALLPFLLVIIRACGNHLNLWLISGKVSQF